MTDIFDASLLPEPETALPAGITLRPLRSTDYSIASVLSVLVDASLSSEAFDRLFEHLRRSDVYYVVVLAEADRIVGTATLLVEEKFLRGGSLAGHIEDVAVAQSHQGQSLGKILISTCTRLADSLGCYKVILDCSAQNVPFYVKCGYEEKGVEMKRYL